MFWGGSPAVGGAAGGYCGVVSAEPIPGCYCRVGGRGSVSASPLCCYCRVVSGGPGGSRSVVIVGSLEKTPGVAARLLYAPPPRPKSCPTAPPQIPHPAARQPLPHILPQIPPFPPQTLPPSPPSQHTHTPHPTTPPPAAPRYLRGRCPSHVLAPPLMAPPPDGPAPPVFM